MIQGNEFQLKNSDTVNLINVDTAANMVVWLFPRTGSKLFSTIFKKTDFKCYQITDREPRLIKPDLIHHHEFTMFPKIKDYKIILTVRNPYSLMAALYYMTSKPSDKNNLKKEFKDHLEIVMYNHPNVIEILRNLNLVDVDYPVRIENLYHDYLRLPIIHKSAVYKEGNLKTLIDSKVNKSESYLAKMSFKEFYTQDSADMVYFLFSKYFDMFGYDKNSWR
jgi:hypothetical protein